MLRDLRSKHVVSRVAESAVAKSYGKVDEKRLIEDFVRRKMRPKQGGRFLEDRKDLSSAYRRLLYAGFRSADILDVLKKFANQPELLEGFEPPEETEGDE